MTKLNINDIVKVKLTEKGRKIYTEYYTRYSVGGVSKIIKLDADGFFHTELWDIMNIFGSHLYMGAEPMFENNEIFI